MEANDRKRLPLSPQEGWLSDGRQVLHFRPLHYSRWNQSLEVISGEWIPDEDIPLLKRREQLTREQTLALWVQRCQAGWVRCPPQW